MSDLFHEDAPDEWIDRVFAIMALTPQHTYQVLTKRAERMRSYCRDFDQRRADALGALVVKLGYDGPLELLRWPLPNVWLGVSAEDQRRANERIPDLLETPATVRFVSAEPLLGPIDFGQWIGLECRHDDATTEWDTGALICRECDEMAHLDWLIIGGESGRDARPMHPDWARSIRDQCAAAGVPFFFKQWGAWVSVSEVEGPGKHHSFPDGATVRCVGKKRAGRSLDGREHSEFPKIAA